MLFNENRLEKIIATYKNDFKDLWGNEEYKWHAVKWFQENWDIDAPDFKEMVVKAFQQNVMLNLLFSGAFMPGVMIIRWAEEHTEQLREMFRNLFNEDLDLEGRVQAFIEASDAIMAGSDLNPYQNTNAVSTYLWLRYPDKYYIYKYSEYRMVAKSLQSDYHPVKGPISSMIDGFKFYDAIREKLLQDEEMKALLSRQVASNADRYYVDNNLNTLTIDLGFYIGNYMWYPREKDYKPGIDSKKWRKLLLNPEIFDEAALKIVKRFHQNGDSGSCLEMSNKYGNAWQFYNSVASTLAIKIHEQLDCKVFEEQDPKDKKKKLKKWWPILFVGRNSVTGEEGTYIYRLREELSTVLDDDSDSDVQARLESVAMYEEGYPKEKPKFRIWKISHGDREFSEAEKNTFIENKVAVVHEWASGYADWSRVKGKDLMEKSQVGDFFFLCHGGYIQLLGQFVESEWLACPEKNDVKWRQMKYKVIATAKDIGKMATDKKKAWTPNFMSTFAEVKSNELDVFEEWILAPYFGLDMADLKEIYEDGPIQSVPPLEIEEVYDLNCIDYHRNRIVFGAPGTGKSYRLEEQRKEVLKVTKEDDKQDLYERVTFYPDYSYAKFVGAYKPVPETVEVEKNGTLTKDKVITYKFVPGPFVRMLVNALSNPNKPYILIIEEINRANAAAVFGDVFQLLDRDENDGSVYPVQTSEDLRAYLEENVKRNLDFAKIRIPNNMFIWCTMNSADQGVFPLDTAFKRRWDFEYVGINDEVEFIPDNEFEIAKQIYYWDDLRQAINNVLTVSKVNEDKLMGPFFLSKKVLENDGIKKNEKFIEAFKSKVIMYLFEDAARQRRKDIFGDGEKRYSDICSAFVKYGIKAFSENVQSEYNALYSKRQEMTAKEPDSET